jgi:hypothetical protein
MNTDKVFIPKKKLLIFNCDSRDDNPQGVAPLIGSYLSWRYKNIVQESELNALARDLQGVIKLSMPARYMSDSASEEDKDVYKEMCNIGRNMGNHSQSSIVLPSDSDPDSRLPLFGIEILHSKGSSAFPTGDIVQRLNTEILMSLYADVLQLGNTGSGSFSLANSKTNIVSFAVEHRLKEIQKTFNTQFIPAIFELNGWDKVGMEDISIDFDNIDDVDASEAAKAVQLLAATGSIEMDRPFFNHTRGLLGLEPYPENEPVHKEFIPEATSRSGDGVEKGSVNGTSDKMGGDNKETDKSVQSK